MLSLIGIKFKAKMVEGNIGAAENLIRVNANEFRAKYKSK